MNQLSKRKIQEQILAGDLTQFNKILFLYKIVQDLMEFKGSCKILKDLKSLADYK